MTAVQSYVITVGTMPVPENPWARRRMRYEARHRRDTTVLSATRRTAAHPREPATGREVPAGRGRHRRSGAPTEKTVTDMISPSAWFASARHATAATAVEDARTPAGGGAHRAPADPDQAPRYTAAYAPGASAYAALGRITAAGEWEAGEWEAAPAAFADPTALADPTAADEPGRARRFGVRPRPGRAGTRPDGSRPRGTARVRNEAGEPVPAQCSPAHCCPAHCPQARQAMPDATAHHGPTQYSTAQHGTAHYGTAQHGTAQYGTAQYGTAQYSTAQYSTAQHGSAGPHAAALGGFGGYSAGPTNVRPRGAHRASAARPGGRHRASGPGRRSYSARHGHRPARLVARTGLTALAVLMLVATFVSAWFTAAGAAAFANIVGP